MPHRESGRHQQIKVEAWGFLHRDEILVAVAGQGHYLTSDANGSRGTFVMRPVFVESIFVQMLDRINLQARSALPGRMEVQDPRRLHEHLAG